MKAEGAFASILQIKDLCRVCLREVDVNINIFKYMLEDNVLISEAIEACLPIQVKEDAKLPQQMCSDCLVLLSQSYAFLHTCLQTEKVLNSYLNVMENKKENDDVVEELIIITGDNINEEINEKSELENNEKPEEQIKSVIKRRFDFGKPSGTTFNCHLCPKLFFKKELLTLHLNGHNKNKSYQCDVCDKKFNFKHNLHRHKLIHEGKKQFACELCGKAFIQRVQLKAHMKTHTKTPSYTCQQCGNTFKFKHSLLRHMATYHAEFYIEPIKKESIPKKKYKLELEFGEGFLCDDCGKSLKTKMALKLHQRIHTGEKPHVCNECGRAFAQASSLVYHKRVHTGEKPYVCTVCARRFTQPAHLKTHMKTHTGEKPYHCSFCDKGFALKKNMIVHTRTHTGEKPYACSVCDKKFVDASSRKKHYKGHRVLEQEVFVEA